MEATLWFRTQQDCRARPFARVDKTLDAFEWAWPKKFNRQQVMNLFRLHFVERASNVVFIGGVGLGKSHLAIALARHACEQRYSVLFPSAIDVINTLTAAQAIGRLMQGLNRYIKPRVLVLDELGYLPIDKTGADLLFQIVSQRYERGSTVIYDQSHLPKMAGNLQRRRHPHFRRPRSAAPLCRNQRHRGQELQDERRQPQFLTAKATSPKATTSNRWI